MWIHNTQTGQSQNIAFNSDVWSEVENYLQHQHDPALHDHNWVPITWEWDIQDNERNTDESLSVQEGDSIIESIQYLEYRFYPTTLTGEVWYKDIDGNYELLESYNHVEILDNVKDLFNDQYEVLVGDDESAVERSEDDAEDDADGETGEDAVDQDQVAQFDDYDIEGLLDTLSSIGANHKPEAALNLVQGIAHDFNEYWKVEDFQLWLENSAPADPRFQTRENWLTVKKQLRSIYEDQIQDIFKWFETQDNYHAFYQNFGRSNVADIVHMIHTEIFRNDADRNRSCFPPNIRHKIEAFETLQEKIYNQPQDIQNLKDSLNLDGLTIWYDWVGIAAVGNEKCPETREEFLKQFDQLIQEGSKSAQYHPMLHEVTSNLCPNQDDYIRELTKGDNMTPEQQRVVFKFFEDACHVKTSQGFTIR